MTDIDTTAPRAEFSAMTEATQEDWNRIAHAQLEFYLGLTDRVLAHLRLLAGDYGGFQVDRLTHSLQTATRSTRRPRRCVRRSRLLHDIGDTLATFNHPDIAAAIVKPFVDESYRWMVEKHGVFQGYYFFHYIGLDPNLRDQFAGHPYFDLCAEFCAEYDQPAFDPDYPTMPLEEFEPLLRSFFATPKQSIYLARTGPARTPARTATRWRVRRRPDRATSPAPHGRQPAGSGASAANSAQLHPESTTSNRRASRSLRSSTAPPRSAHQSATMSARRASTAGWPHSRYHASSTSAGARQASPQSMAMTPSSTNLEMGVLEVAVDQGRAVTLQLGDQRRRITDDPAQRRGQASVAAPRRRRTEASHGR